MLVENQPTVAFSMHSYNLAHLGFRYLKVYLAVLFSKASLVARWRYCQMYSLLLPFCSIQAHQPVVWILTNSPGYCRVIRECLEDGLPRLRRKVIIKGQN